jgi:mannose-6-phosphate isomerase-like protein (cupin superfamily)
MSDDIQHVHFPGQLPSADSADEDRRRLLLILSAAAGVGALGLTSQNAKADQCPVPQSRRALTGRDESGRSVFQSFGVTPQVVTFETSPGLAFYEIYSTDGVPRLTGREPDPMLTKKGIVPGPGGSLFRLVLFPPRSPEGSKPAPDAYENWLKEHSKKVPGWAELFERDTPGMHTTDTIDYVVVIRGEIILELDDGKTVHLRQGDCVVQNGTRHRWSNPSSEPCLIAAVLIGGRRQG